MAKNYKKDQLHLYFRKTLNTTIWTVYKNSPLKGEFEMIPIKSYAGFEPGINSFGTNQAHRAPKIPVEIETSTK